MAGDKKQPQIWWLALGILILLVPVFFHLRSQNPFLFPKEMLVKFSVLVLLGIVLWNYNKFFSIFILFCFSHSFANLSERSLWALDNLRDFFLFYLLLRLVVKPKDARFLLGLWFASLLAPLIMGWLQFYGIDFLPRSESSYVNSYFDYSIFYGEYWKITAFFGNPHFLMAWIALCSPLVFLMPLYLALPSLIFLVITLLTFGSRGGHLFTLIIGSAIAFTFLYSKGKRILISTAIILTSSLIAIIYWGTKFQGFLQVRKEILFQAWPKILEHPIIGHGLNSWGALKIYVSNTWEAQAHNEYLQTYVELGAFALLIPIFILYYLNSFRKIIQKEGAVLLGVFCAFVFNAVYSFPFHLAHSAIYFLTIIALSDILLETKVRSTD